MLHPPAPLHKGDESSLFLTILIQPCEELTIPMNRVLWLQDPVVFFREEEELSFHTHHASCIEGSHDRGDLTLLREKIPQIHNVEILGSVIYSQVYYYIYHAEEPKVHFDQAEAWLTAALRNY